jgi:ppGpp synthetase/RelA/SpoT-type nucleotidyltranferase
MILPASFEAKYAELRPHLEFLAEQIDGQLRSVLSSIETAFILSRIKEPESVLLKLQRGDVSSLLEVDDMVGLKVVVPHPGDLSRAYASVEQGMTVVRVVNADVGRPEDFPYREPHVIVRLPDAVATRHPEAGQLMAEIQITTYLQHALQESVHSVAYKGELFSWRRWRLAAQLRGTLELADNVLEQVAEVAKLQGDPAYPPFDERNRIVETCREVFREVELPSDLRRLALIVEMMLAAAQMSLEDLKEGFLAHEDLTRAISLSPVDKVIAVILRQKGHSFIDRLPKNARRIIVSPELEDACPEAGRIPANRRVLF